MNDKVSLYLTHVVIFEFLNCFGFCKCTCTISCCILILVSFMNLDNWQLYCIYWF